METNRSILRRAAVAAAVCSLGLMSGCASLGNSYLEHENFFGKDDGKSCFKAESIGDEDHEVLQTYLSAVGCARQVQSNYRNALSERSRFRRKLGTGMIGLSAATLGLGLAGATTDATLVTGLIGASGAGSYQWLNAPAEERAWIAGYNAIECTIAAMNPLVMPTAEYSIDSINSDIGLIETAMGEIGTAARDVRGWVQKCRGGDCGDGAEPGQIEELVKRAEGHIAQVSGKLADGRQARRAAVRIAGDIRRAPVRLEGAVRRIIGEVDLAIQQQALSLDALSNIVSSVAERYSSLTDIPAADVGGESPEPEPVDDPDSSDEGGEQLLENKRASLTMELREQLSFKLPDIQKSLQNLRDSSQEIQESLNTGEMVETLRKLQERNEISGFNQSLLREFSSDLRRIGDIVGQLEALSPEFKDLLQDAVKYDHELIKMRLRKIEELEQINERLLKRKALESSDRYRFQQALSKLTAAYRTLENAVASLGDITKIIIERQPLEQIKSCGVNPDSIVGPLRAEPANIPFDSPAKASRSVLVKGGVKPYLAQSLSQEHGVSVQSQEFGGAVFTISISDTTPPGRYEIMIGDGAERRILVPVQVPGGDDTGPAPETNAPDGDATAARISTADADDDVAQRINRVEGIITARTVGEIKRAQRALCLPDDQVDGIWGPATQKAFEKWVGGQERLAQDQLNQLIGTEVPNSDCQSEIESPSE
ncbi:MAG: hypothetical protein WD397_04135 [Wenzhouxiangellaceae bacterium]